MIISLSSRISILACGALYPGYMSFKSLRAKNVQNYPNWVMYWIVFALFMAAEAIADILLTWLPLYYLVKLAFILWLLPTTTNGSSIIYKNCIHPLLIANETRVDFHLSQFEVKGMGLLFCIVRRIMDVVKKIIPHVILPLRVTNNLPNTSEEEYITAEETETQVQDSANAITNQRKGSTKAKGNKVGVVEKTTQTRGRKTTRQSNSVLND